jgi:hypothetical protein
MTRWLLKLVDIGMSAVFAALCVKALCISFVEDIKQQLPVRKPSLIALDAIKQAAILLFRSAPHYPNLPHGGLHAHD